MSSLLFSAPFSSFLMFPRPQQAENATLNPQHPSKPFEVPYRLAVLDFVSLAWHEHIFPVPSSLPFSDRLLYTHASISSHSIS